MLTIVFMAYSFCYIFILQSDMLAYLQHVLSEGHTTYNRLVGSLIVVFLVFIPCCVNLFDSVLFVVQTFNLFGGFGVNSVALY